jgi:hypothetical protein
MLDYLKPIKDDNFDFLTFLAGDEEGSIQISGQEFNEPGEPVDVGFMGSSYHIIIFRDHETDNDRYSDVESFDAVLSEPLEYVSRMITQGWYGIIARKTTTSRPLINRMLDKFKETV